MISRPCTSGTAVTQSSDQEKGLPALSSENASVAPQPGIAALATGDAARRFDACCLQSREVRLIATGVSDDADQPRREGLAVVAS